LSPFTWEAFASFSGGPAQKAEKRSLIEKEIQKKSIFGYKLICSFLFVFTASLIVFYLLFFFVLIFLRNTALLRRAGQERLNIVNTVVRVREFLI